MRLSSDRMLSISRSRSWDSYAKNWVIATLRSLLKCEGNFISIPSSTSRKHILTTKMAIAGILQTTFIYHMAPG